MTWIDKELQRRQKHESKRGGTAGDSALASTSVMGPESDAKSIAALWERLKGANAALPDELRLPLLEAGKSRFDDDFAVCKVLLRAANGAGIGFTGSAVRYIWPKKRLRKSNNLWIKADGAGGYVVSRRVKTSLPGLTLVEAAFNERAVEHILRCLVTARQVTWRAVTRRRFWLF